MTIATESGHWYDKDGNPKYTIMGKNGKERNTTLRDARKEDLFPSVTSVLGIIDKPGLNRWKENQILMSALTLPKIDGESLDDFSKRVKEDAKQQSEAARDKGTLIHGQVERYFMYKKCEPEYLFLCMTIEERIHAHFGLSSWSAEKSFSHPLGFGGKVDLHRRKDPVVIDFKTSEFTEDALPKKYPDKLWQLSAYKYGLGLTKARIANVYISTSVDNLIYILEWTQAESEQGWETFKSILRAWQDIKNFHPVVNELPF